MVEQETDESTKEESKRGSWTWATGSTPQHDPRPAPCLGLQQWLPSVRSSRINCPMVTARQPHVLQWWHRWTCKPNSVPKLSADQCCVPTSL